MILSIVILDITDKAIVAIAELLVGWLQRHREIVATQVDTGQCRADIRLGSVPTCSLRRVHIESLEIAIRHMIACELRVVVARSTHTRVSYYHIVGIEITRNDGAERTRSVLGLRAELSQAASIVHAITTIVASADELQLALADRFSLEECALGIGKELVDGSLALLAFGTLLHDDGMLF